MTLWACIKARAREETKMKNTLTVISLSFAFFLLSACHDDHHHGDGAEHSHEADHSHAPTVSSDDVVETESLYGEAAALTAAVTDEDAAAENATVQSVQDDADTPHQHEH